MSTTRTKIFVGHLPDGCRSDDLQALFGKYGTVTECDVINKYGFVHMSTAQEADAAIRCLNNYNFMGSALSVEPSKSKLHPEPGAPGRAMGGRPIRGGFQQNGYDAMPSSSANGYRRFDSPSFGGPANDSYFSDPSFGYARERIRHYPTSYDRLMGGMPSMREEFVRRPMPSLSGTQDPYARPSASLFSQSDVYRRPPSNSSDYPYSQKSPSMSSLPSNSRPYWYNETFNDVNERPSLQSGGYRPFY